MKEKTKRRKLTIKEEESNGNKLGKVAKLFLKDLKKENIKIIKDKELDNLLRKAIIEKDKDARDKVIKQILPLIVGKCKKYFREDYIVETLDVIQETMLKVLENMEEKFDIERQEEGRCALFFTWVNYCILWAINTVRSKYLKMPGRDGKGFKELVYTGGDEIECNLDFGKLIEEGWGDKEIELLDEISIYSKQDVESDYVKKEMIEKVVLNNFEKAGISMLLYLGYWDGNLNDKQFLSLVEKRLFDWIENNREVLRIF